MSNKHLGCEANDKITGFTGTITGFVEYITGCNQYLITAKATDNKPPESIWCDVQRVEVKLASKIVLDNGATPGHDRVPPIR